MRFVAVENFHDHDGVLVERGDVFPGNAAVVRHFPGQFLRSTTGGGLIQRVGGTAELVYEPTTSRPRRSIVKRSGAARRAPGGRCRNPQ